MITVGSLFAGIGGIELGLEWTGGFETVWQVENDEYATRVLARHWPEVSRWGDVRTCTPTPVVVLCGGDPCPKHSRARSNGPARHPDLAGYFLAVAGRLRPKWLVRENVPSPTTVHFEAALDALGYGAVVVRIDAAALTGQSRQRDFIVARNSISALELKRTVFADLEDGPGPYTTRLGTRQIVAALTTHRTRYDSRDNYVWSPGEEKGLRILESEEREAFAGFPPGWTAGFSPATRARMLGNAVVPQVAQWIGQRILEIERQRA